MPLRSREKIATRHDKKGLRQTGRIEYEHMLRPGLPQKNITNLKSDMSASSTEVKKHPFGMIAVFLSVFLLAAAVIICLQPLEYEVSSSILIRQGKNQPAADLKTELNILRSAELTEKTLAAVGAERLYPQQDDKERAKQFQADFTAHPAQGAARIIELSFCHPDAELAAETVGAAVALFAKQLEKLNDPQTALLMEELELRRKQMQQAQNVLAMFRQNDRLQGIDDWQTQYLGIKRGRLEAVLEEETRMEEVLAGELAELRRQFTALPSSDAASRDEFLKMTLYRQELLRKYEPENPLLAAVEAQLAQLRQQLQPAAAAAKLADQIVAASLAHAKQQEGREAAQRELNQLAASLLRQEEQKKIFSGLMTEVEKSRELYAQQFTKVEERKKTAVKEGYVSVIEPPRPPLKPNRPNKLRSVALAAGLGLLASLLWNRLQSRRS